MIEWIVSSSVLIAVVLAVRSLCKPRLSCRARYALWLLALFRLLVPVQLYTASWGVPAPKLPERPAVVAAPTQTTESAVQKEEVITNQNNQIVYYEAESKKAAIKPEDVLRALWLTGAGGLAAVLLVSNLRFALRLRRVRVAYAKGVYVAEGLPSPCLVGVLRPTIYLTPESTRDERTLRHVLAHEETHRRHGDGLWSLLRLAAVCLHWYNPLVWLAVVVSKRDGELACDEATLERLGADERAAYGETLLHMVRAKHGARELLSCSTSMSAKPMRERIETIARRPRTRLAALLLSLAVVLGASVLAFSKQPEPEPTEATETLTVTEGLPDMEWETYHGDGWTITKPKDWTCQETNAESFIFHAIDGEQGESLTVTRKRHSVEAELDDCARRGMSVDWELKMAENETLHILCRDLSDRECYVVTWQDPTGQYSGVLRWVAASFRVDGAEYPAATELWYADLDSDGAAERLVLDWETLTNGGEARLWIETADGARIEAATAATSHAGWNTVALTELDGEAYLLFYHPTMYQGEATYSYSLAAVRDKMLVTLEQKEVAFSANPDGMAKNDRAAMRAFQVRANDLWQNSRLLFTTDQEVLAHLYDAATGKPIPTNGAYYIAAEGETVRYTETMYGLPLDEPEPVDEAAFFSAVAGNYWFLSGAGGWHSELDIRADGTFTGFHRDFDLNTVYYCDFSGRFKDIVKVNDFTYSMRLRELDATPNEGEEHVESTGRWIGVQPYGIENTDELLVFMPGASVDKLPEAFIRWYAAGLPYGREQIGDALPTVGLYCVEQGYGWFAWELIAPLIHEQQPEPEPTPAPTSTAIPTPTPEPEPAPEGSMVVVIDLNEYEGGETP